MKQTEDIIPAEFARNKIFTSDTSYNNELRAKYLEIIEYDRSSMKEHFTKNESSSNYFPAVVLFLALGLLLLSKLFYSKGYKQLIESKFSIIKFRYWLRDSNSALRGLFFYTIPVYFLLLTLIISSYISKVNNSPQQIDPSLFLVILIILCGWFFLREFLMWMPMIIFKSNKSTSEQRRNNYIHNTITALFLVIVLPFSIYFYNYNITEVTLIVCVLIEIIRVISGIIIAINLGEFYTYYFFLYFCTVEIIPALIFLKIGLILIFEYTYLI